MKNAGRSIARVLSLALLGALGLAQIAQASKLPDFSRAGVTTTGKSATIGMTGNGVEWGSTIPISPVAGGWTYAGNYGVPQAAKGTTMNMNASGEVFFSGTKYPFQAGYTVPASNVFAGLRTAAEIAGGVMGGPWGLALIVGSAAAPYIKEWVEDSGLRVNPDGGNGIQRGDPWYCASNCYEYRGSFIQSWNRSPEQACKDHAAYNANTFVYYGYAHLGGGAYQCQEKWKSGGGNNYFTLLRQARAADVAKQWYDLPSMDDIAPYMTPRPFDPRVVPEILSKGGDIPMPDPTITGPSSLPGPSQVNKNPDGTTTTINTTNNYQIAGNTITNISNVTSTTITNSNSQVISTSTNTVTPATTDDKPDFCKTNPSSLMCAKFGDPSAPDKIQKETKNVTITPVSFAGGSCPGPVEFAVFGRSYGFSYDTLCGKLAALSSLFLALAGLTAAWIFTSGFRV